MKWLTILRVFYSFHTSVCLNIKGYSRDRDLKCPLMLFDGSRWAEHFWHEQFYEASEATPRLRGAIHPGRGVVNRYAWWTPARELAIIDCVATPLGLDCNYTEKLGTWTIFASNFGCKYPKIANINIAIKRRILHCRHRKWFWISRFIANTRKLQKSGLQISGEHCTYNVLPV